MKKRKIRQHWNLTLQASRRSPLRCISSFVILIFALNHYYRGFERSFRKIFTRRIRRMWAGLRMAWVQWQIADRIRRGQHHPIHSSSTGHHPQKWHPNYRAAAVIVRTIVRLYPTNGGLWMTIYEQEPKSGSWYEIILPCSTKLLARMAWIANR